MKRRSAIKNSALLFGGVISVSTLSGLFQSCGPDSTKITGDSLFFESDQMDLISKIADILIPDGKFPGAIQVGVPQVLEILANEYLPENEKQILKSGFVDFDKECNLKYGRGFLECTEDEKLNFLQAEEKKANESQSPNLVSQLKSYIYEAYFNSEIGVQQVLKYEPIPMSFQGCVSFSEINGTWVNLESFSL